MTPLKEDLAFRNSLEFDVFSTTQRNADGKQTTVEFPFRVSAMRLPWWDKLDFSEMQRQAQALAFGLDPDDSIREVFSFGRQIYPWASDTITRNAVATFVAGLGECAHVNK
jgi:hypothetical protein